MPSKELNFYFTEQGQNYTNSQENDAVIVSEKY